MQGVQGYVQGDVQGKSLVFIGLCRVCRGFSCAHAREQQYKSVMHVFITRTRSAPLHTLHTLHTPYFMRVTFVQGCAATPAHPAHAYFYSSCFLKNQLTSS